jgi:hypothetical protein
VRRKARGLDLEKLSDGREEAPLETFRAKLDLWFSRRPRYSGLQGHVAGRE